MINKELDKLHETLYRFGCCCIIFIAIAVIIAVGWGIVELIKYLEL